MTRIMRNVRRRSVGVLLFLLAVVAFAPLSDADKPAPPTPPPVTYNLTVLDQDLTFWKMNEAGQAVGWTSGTLPLAKVRLANGSVIDLTTEFATNSDPGWQWSLLDYAVEINSSGQIAGRGWRIEEDGEPHARLFRFSPAIGELPARLEAIRTFMGGDLHVGGMNDAGEVLLHEEIPDVPDGVWVAAGLPGEVVATEIPLQTGPLGAIPLGINNFGQITGQLDAGTRSVAFRYSPATSTTELFGTISGTASTSYYQSSGEDINDWGVIAGSALKGRPRTGKEDTSPWAVRLNGSTWETVAGGGSSVSTALNNYGVTVGTRTGVSGQGFVYLAGKMYSLRDLVVSPPANLRLLLPRDITDNGQICGEAVFANADGTLRWGGGFVLTPVAAP